MEERIIDDEYGRGVRLRKTKDGFVDVTDELADESLEEGEEIAFEFPIFADGEEDETLVDLSPEEAERVRREKAEREEQRRTAYKHACEEGQALLDSGSYRSAELKFEQALRLDGLAPEASVGYWRAKTQGFANPDALVEEYLDSGFEEMEFDLGYEAVDILRKEHCAVFQKRIEELNAEEAPLMDKVKETQARRREVLAPRRKRGVFICLGGAIPFLAAVIVTLVLGLKNFTTPDNRFVLPTVIAGGAALLLFIVFAFTGNTLINACRMYNLNEQLSSTDEGKRVQEIREYKAMYEALCKPVLAVEETEE
ncbi:MAG: hypothetical protein IKB20_02530 [Clostridia bacterium]|nr:hypothetical protein [Clostridia bacterium]